MNREIKFRIWSKKEKSFIKQKFTPLEFAIACLIDSEFRKRTCDSEENNLIFQQFTGLKDKNGREIYEGDVILTNHFGDRVAGVIEYRNNSFDVNGKYISHKDAVTRIFNCYGKMDFLEIIGNISENPELIS